MTVNLALPADAVEAIVDKVIDRLEYRGEDPWLTVDESADYIRASSRQRVFDLRASGRLPRHGDGRRALNRRSDLDALIEQDKDMETNNEQEAMK